MIDTNYVGSIVKILEIPEQKLINENNIPEWSAYFDPNVFHNMHGNLEIENWRMTND